MGMFDDFEYEAAHAAKFCCVKCGTAIVGMQTKDFDCYMDRLRLVDDGRLLRKRSWLYTGNEDPQTFEPVFDTCYVYVYSSCPVDDTWNEWRVHVVDGVVQAIERVT